LGAYTLSDTMKLDPENTRY